MSEILHKLLTEQLNYYRLQRHDFMNHWQVVMGYLQLNKAESALSYLRKGLGDLQAEQAVGQIPEPVVSAVLLGMILQLKREDVNVSAVIANSLQKEHFWQNHRSEEYGEAFYGYTRECISAMNKFERIEKERPSVVITLIPDDASDGAICKYMLKDMRESEETILYLKEFKLRSLTNVL